MNVTENVSPWVAAAQSIAPAAPMPMPAPATPGEGIVFVAAHGGAGATVWAGALGGIDGSRTVPAGGAPVVLVIRASVDGIAAAKSAVASHGVAAFACVLVVPASPGRTPRLIADELKVLSGAVRLVPVPWVPALLLKHASQAGPADVPAKELQKIHTALISAGVTIQGEMK